MVGPLGGRERHEEQRAQNDQQQASGRSLSSTGDAPVAQHGSHDDANAEEQHDHGEAAREAAVDGLLHEGFVATELLEPLHRRADFSTQLDGLGDGAQRLVCEHSREDRGAGGQERRDLRQDGRNDRLLRGTLRRAQQRQAAGENADQRAQGGQQGGDGHQASRARSQRQGGDDRADRGGQQAVGGDGAFEGDPSQQGEHGDDRLRARAVVEGHPEQQERCRHGPVGDLALVDLGAEAWHDLTGKEQPRDNARDQRGQAHPDGCGGDLRHQCQQVVERRSEGGFRYAEPAVVVGHVAGLVGDLGHGQQVAVIRGVGTDKVPGQQDEADYAVERSGLPPVAVEQAAGRSSLVEDIDAVQTVQGNRGGDDAHEDGQVLDGRRGRGEARIDGDVCLEARVDRAVGVLLRVLDIRVDAGESGANVGIDGGIQRVVQVLVCVRNPGAGGFVVGGDAQLCVVRQLPQSVLINGQRDDVAHDHVEAVVGGADEHAAQGGLCGFWREGGQNVCRTAFQVANFLDGNRDVYVLGDVGDQGRLDGCEVIVLRPVERGLYLVYRQERQRKEHHHADEAGDDGR